MLGYSKEALETAKNYMVGKSPNRVYSYKGKLVVFYAQGESKSYTDTITAFDSRTGEQLPILIREMGDFNIKSKKIV